MGSDLLYEHRFEAEFNYSKYKRAISEIMSVLNHDYDESTKLEKIEKIIKELHG